MGSRQPRSCRHWPGWLAQRKTSATRKPRLSSRWGISQGRGTPQFGVCRPRRSFVFPAAKLSTNVDIGGPLSVNPATAPLSRSRRTVWTAFRLFWWTALACAWKPTHQAVCIFPAAPIRRWWRRFPPAPLAANSTLSPCGLGWQGSCAANIIGATRTRRTNLAKSKQARLARPRHTHCHALGIRKLGARPLAPESRADKTGGASGFGRELK